MSIIQTLIQRGEVEELASRLDAMSHTDRCRGLFALRRGELRLLYERVEGVWPLSLSDFVPEEQLPLTEVIHEGINTLPTFRRFQKRFCRPSEPEREVLWGYNHQWFGQVTGPGYFSARPGWASDPVVISYIEPAEERAPSWPPLAPSHARLGRFIYRNTEDRMRRVSAHVTVGAAYRGRDALGAWFLLCREVPGVGLRRV
jgi:hypothetical protein